MAKTDRADRLKPRLPRGFQDQDAATLRATRAMLETIRSVFERYGFDPVETPAVEYTEALGKFLPDQDRPNEGVFSFQDDDEQWLSLRYDLTAPLARYVAENFDRLPKPYRSYRFGYVFRNEKPGPGRFRQFMQFDADTVGSASASADAEICMMAADVMEELGIRRGDYVVRVNNRKFLDGVMDVTGVPIEKRLTVLRALDKYDRLKKEGVRLLLGKGRKDDSGDWTKGAELSEEQIKRLIYFLTIRSEPWGIAGGQNNQFNPQIRLVRDSDGEPYETDVLSALGKAYGTSDQFHEAVEDFRRMESLIVASGYGDGRIVIDPSVVRGLEYYTGPVYEVELTFETVNEKGEKARFGSVAGGGRYDGLVGRFRPEDTPATGFSIGVSRLLAALSALGRVETKDALGPVVVLVMDRDRIADYQKMVAALRVAGVRAEMYLGAAGMKAQMKYADRRNSPCVVIQGENERIQTPPVVQIKDLIEGARLAGTIEGHEEWREARPAQITVPEADLVETVRDIVARHR